MSPCKACIAETSVDALPAAAHGAMPSEAPTEDVSAGASTGEAVKTVEITFGDEIRVVANGSSSDGGPGATEHPAGDSAADDGRRSPDTSAGSDS